MSQKKKMAPARARARRGDERKRLTAENEELDKQSIRVMNDVNRLEPRYEVLHEWIMKHEATNCPATPQPAISSISSSTPSSTSPSLSPPPFLQYDHLESSSDLLNGISDNISTPPHPRDHQHRHHRYHPYPRSITPHLNPSTQEDVDGLQQRGEEPARGSLPSLTNLVPTIPEMESFDHMQMGGQLDFLLELEIPFENLDWL